jgi:hypothetical protein
MYIYIDGVTKTPQPKSSAPGPGWLPHRWLGLQGLLQQGLTLDQPMDGLNHWVLPSGYVNIAIENGPFIVDLPIKHGDFP